MPSVKNIVIVNDFGSINGGAAQVAIHTALGLAWLGYRVYYFCAVPPVDRELAANSNIQVVCTQQADLLSSGSRFSASRLYPRV